MFASRTVLAVCAAACALACGSASKEPEPQGAAMGQLVSDEAIAAVRICRTTEQELVDGFGAPSGRGRDGDMGTLTWSSIAIVTAPEEAAVGRQMIVAWIDSDGLVAGFVVNTVGIPQKPAPCREQQPTEPPAGEPPADEPAPQPTFDKSKA